VTKCEGGWEISQKVISTVKERERGGKPKSDKNVEERGEGVFCLYLVSPM